MRPFLLGLLLVFAALAEVRPIRSGQDPQAVFDKAAAGDHIVFLPGLHRHKLQKHRSLLYVDKAMDIELRAGAVLQLADNQSVVEKAPEITTDQGVHKSIDDFSAGGEYDLSLGAIIFSVRIDSVGTNGAPDTFTWGSGKAIAFQHKNVPITGDWQSLSNGVKIRFDKTSGHTLESVWFVSYDGPEAYGIRIGHGRQTNYIENVRVFGQGTIDLNSGNNAQPSFLVKDINACILVHGRVRNVSIEGVTMTNTNRSVMLYGEHTGKFLQGGAVGPGESFDAENISIQHTRTINPTGSGYLLGHPSHRGWLRKVRCNHNYMETATTSIEPNFQLDQYEVIGNVIKSAGRAIHCWRRSTNGLIVDNVRLDDATGMEVVMVNAPAAWKYPENIILRDNRNHLSDPVGRWANVSGGMENQALGAYATVSGGRGNRAIGPYSSASGWQAVARRPGEAATAVGAFATVGDAQTSLLVGKVETKTDAPGAIRFGDEDGLTLAAHAVLSFRAHLLGTSADSQIVHSVIVTGVALHREGSVVLQGLQQQLVHSGAPSLGVQVTGGPKLQLLVMGSASRPMRWVARVETVEIVH